MNDLYELNNATLTEKVEWLRKNRTHNESKKGYLSQQELAKELDISTGAYNNLVKNGSCNLSTIYAVADYFNVSIDWLCSRSAVSDIDYDLNFVSDYIGLPDEIVLLLKSKHNERKIMQDFNKHFAAGRKNNRDELSQIFPLIDKNLCDIITLYFEKVQSIIHSYVVNSEELKIGIRDYKEYLRIKEYDYKVLAAYVLKGEGKDKEANELFEYFRGNIADDVIDNRELNLEKPLNATNSALFQVQDAFITYAKSLCDITESSQQVYELLNDISIFVDIENIYKAVQNNNISEIIEDISKYEDKKTYDFIKKYDN